MEKCIQVSVRSFSELQGEIPLITEADSCGIAANNGICYLRTGDRIYSCEDSPEGRELLAKLRTSEKSQKEYRSEEEALREMFAGKTDSSALLRFGFPDRVQRCVILFHPFQKRDMQQLCDLIPAEETDRIISAENGDLVMVMHMDCRDADEVFEFAEAVIGTMESEAGIDCCAGIGRTAENTGGLFESFRNASAAIETGLRYRIPGKVFAYDRQTLERITDAISPDTAAAIRQEILKPGSEKVLTEEILETIRVFFRNDLNLSTTARQLFIHRNTLLYRMEKIKKETGLDLRKFEDAVVFRMLMNPSEEQEDHR